MNKVEIESFQRLAEENVKLREENARLRLSQLPPTGSKIAVIKLVRELTGKSLKDAKDTVDAIWR